MVPPLCLQQLLHYTLDQTSIQSCSLLQCKPCATAAPLISLLTALFIDFTCVTIRWPVVAEVARKVLGWRLKAMPYLYTAFYDSHTFGCPIARPLWFTFPSDGATLRLHEQWMMGALLGSPYIELAA